jgi:membrane associated rhomboid family serine protease
VSFRFAPGGPGQDDPWFRVGTVDVGSATLLAGLATLSMVVFAFVPPVASALALYPETLLTGQVWRLATWPFANVVSLWTVLNIFFLWYFGNDLERQIGRKPFLWMFVAFTLVLSFVAVILGLVTGLGGVLAGIGGVELIVLLVWIADNPTRRFLFNIPAWALGAVIVGLQVLGFLASRDAFGLLSLLLGLALCAVVAKSFGLLGEYAWLPSLRARAGQGGQGGQRGRSRRQRKRKPSFQSGRPTVVSGPWEHRGSGPAARDRARLDELLDKISAGGMDSLSEREKRELLELRKRLSSG